MRANMHLGGGAGPRLALAHERSACHITVRLFSHIPCRPVLPATPRTKEITSRRGRSPGVPTHRRGDALQTGTVKWFNATKGFGFIQPDNGGPDAFVHISAVERAGLDNLREGERIQYELVRGKTGKSSAEGLKRVG
jgi:cold shock protein